MTNKDDNNFSINTDVLEQRKALNQYKHTISSMNKEPANKFTNKFDEVRIRIGKIDNYLIDRSGGRIDPLDTDRVINMISGKVSIQWIGYSGGFIRTEEYEYPSPGFTEDWKYDPSKDCKEPEKRTLHCYNHNKASAREIVDLTHAFIWNNDSNWAGVKSLPPVGSIVVCGQTRNNKVIILGYLQDQNGYRVSRPYLKPGETIIKGYGNNYTHWRFSDKLDTHVWCIKDTTDLDDPKKEDKYDKSIEMWQRFDCYNKYMLMTVENIEDIDKSLFEMTPTGLNSRTTDKNGNKGEEIITANDVTISCSSRSSTARIVETANSITAKINGSAIFKIDSSSLSMSTGSTKLTVNPYNVSINRDLRVSNSTYTNNLYIGGIEIRDLIEQICASVCSSMTSSLIKSPVKSSVKSSVRNENEKDIKIKELEERIEKLEKIIKGDNHE